VVFISRSVTLILCIHQKLNHSVLISILIFYYFANIYAYETVRYFLGIFRQALLKVRIPVLGRLCKKILKKKRFPTYQPYVFDMQQET